MRAMVKKNLINLPVETRSGQSLGKLMDIELDVDQHMAINYHVKTSALLPGVLSKKLIIGRQQVVGITEEKIVVEDSVVKETANEKKWQEMPATAETGTVLGRRMG